MRQFPRCLHSPLFFPLSHLFRAHILRWLALRKKRIAPLNPPSHEIRDLVRYLRKPFSQNWDVYPVFPNCHKLPKLLTFWHLPAIMRRNRTDVYS